MDFLLFAAAIAVLIYGADVVVRESERIALHFNISSFVLSPFAASASVIIPGKANRVKPAVHPIVFVKKFLRLIMFVSVLLNKLLLLSFDSIFSSSK